jgi:hypothetical protein
LDESDLEFGNRRNFLNQPNQSERTWRAAAAAFDYRPTTLSLFEPYLCLNFDACMLQLSVNKIACRGTSKFPWDGKQRSIEFPAVTPHLLPRLVFFFVLGSVLRVLAI